MGCVAVRCGAVLTSPLSSLPFWLRSASVKTSRQMVLKSLSSPFFNDFCFFVTPDPRLPPLEELAPAPMVHEVRVASCVYSGCMD